MSTQADPVDENPRASSVAGPRGRSGKTRIRRRGVRIALWTLLVVLLTALGVGGWALNRYVIDHVEISDVNSYESSVNADSTEAPIATFSVEPSTELPLELPPEPTTGP